LRVLNASILQDLNLREDLSAIRSLGICIAAAREPDTIAVVAAFAAALPVSALAATTDATAEYHEEDEE